MIDTVGILMTIPKRIYEKILSRSIQTSRVDKDTGEIEFEYNNFSTSYSWGYKVLFKVDDHCYQYDPGTKKTSFARCLPFIKFEFSVPKIMRGNNLDSSTEIIEACFKVKENFDKKYDVTLPGLDDWHCYRIDTCSNFLMNNEIEVRSFIRYLQRFNYPRRIKNNYEDTGIYFASRHNTLKVYAKGAEFKKHDSLRYINEIERKQLQKKADSILRIEVEHKNSLKYIKKKIEDIQRISLRGLQGYMTLYDSIKNIHLIEEMERVMDKFLCGIKTKVMKNLDVFTILKNHLGSKSGTYYYSVYMLLITQGQAEVKRQINRSTYYKALSIFRELKISILASDIEKTDYFLDQGFPEDFSLKMNSENKYYQLPLAA